MSENNAQNSNEPKYDNLTTTGIGYLSRAREVKKQGVKPYWSVGIAALRGKRSDGHKTFFDCIVTGANAKQDIVALADLINDKNKSVFCSFVIGDGYPDSFEFQSGDKKGETGHVIKGHLLRIKSAFVDGEKIQLAGDNESEGEESSGDESSASANGTAHEAGNSDVQVEESDVVKLSKDDPNFEQRKQQLKAAGYKWDADQKAWVKPAVAA